MQTAWAEKIVDEKWVDCFESQPLVDGSKDSRASCQPLALYMDVSEFAKRESVLICTIHFLVSGFRHLLFAVMKSDFCDCGCGGWCTIQSLFRMVEWSLQALADGLWPSHRHDGTAWGPTDGWRARMSGCALGFKGIVLDIVNDWCEVVHRWGLPSWAHNDSPCFRCFLKKSELPSARPSDWRRKTQDDYDEYCGRCEIWISMPDALAHRKVRFSLQEHKNRA